MINDYIAWINEKINEALGKYALTYPEYNNSSDPWVVLLFSGLDSEPNTTIENKRSLKFSIEVGYLLEEGLDLSSKESTFIDNFESLINKFEEHLNRSPGVKSGDILKLISLEVGIANKGGATVRLGKIILTIDVIT